MSNTSKKNFMNHPAAIVSDKIFCGKRNKFCGVRDNCGQNFMAAQLRTLNLSAMI